MQVKGKMAVCLLELYYEESIAKQTKVRLPVRFYLPFLTTTSSEFVNSKIQLSEPLQETHLNITGQGF